VQELVLLEDGWGLKLTTAVFSLPAEKDAPGHEDGSRVLRPEVEAGDGDGAAGDDPAFSAAVARLAENLKR
jgi:hypothetical protein